MATDYRLPVAVIGAGPIGLAAAAHLARRGQSFVVIEAGSRVGHNVRAWSHVAMFSPWRYNVDSAARQLLAAAGWREPEPDEIPTGKEWLERYIEPLGAVPEIAPHVVLRTQVIAVARERSNRSSSAAREIEPFTLRLHNDWRSEFGISARAVIDASGTWSVPDPAGANGIRATGESNSAAHIYYHIPDVLGHERARYAGRRVLVVGTGHTALATLVGLGQLKDESPSTSIVWALREPDVETALADPDVEILPGLAGLVSRVYTLVADQVIEVLNGFHLKHIAHTNAGLLEIAGQSQAASDQVTADELVVGYGFRPDLTFLSELRLALDPIWECAQDITPLVDPSLHSRCDVPPHGATQLRHPEANFYIIGAKSYGRAPTFLAMTGCEQARSVVAELAGDQQEARHIDLPLPTPMPLITGAKGSTRPQHCIPRRPVPAAMNWLTSPEDRERP